VFQNYALYPHMTVAEHRLCSEAAESSQGRDHTKVREAAQLLGLSDYLNSSRTAVRGQRQVSHGRAIVREPRCS